MNQSETKKGFLEGLTPGQALLFGFLVSLSVLSVSLNIVLGTMLARRGNAVSAPTAYGGGEQYPTAGDQPMQPTTPQTFTITKDNHIRGNFNAKVTLVEFSDFECPFCSRFHPTLKQVMSEYGDKVRLVYKHFPLSFHAQAQKAAEASECASEQGKFWEMHDKIFDNQEQLSLASLKQWARDLRLNGSKFDSCLDTGKYAGKVAADLSEGEQKGVSGTPATFINGQMVSGAVSYATLKQIIDAELAK